MALRVAATAAALAALVTGDPAVAQQMQITPAFSIWDVELGEPLTQIPAAAIIEVSCGTNGGPPSKRLRSLSDFTECPAEQSGLHEVYFAYDDELDYIAKAMESEYKVLQGGTSIYAHPVILSVLVDEGGIVRGIRIVTDDRISDRERRVAVNLSRNLKARFSRWDTACDDIPLQPGENPVGRQFTHEVCAGDNPELGQSMYLEAFYLRKRGQEAINRETQEINSGYFSSGTRFELTQHPYEPLVPDFAMTVSRAASQ
jgi:hypothetical protein